MRHVLLFLMAAAAAGAGFAQDTIAPTPDTVGSPRGTDTGDYNVVDSFETGYRFVTIGGNSTTYQSDVNYGNGIRLLNSSLTINSKDGHGKFFDELVLTTQGLGNDPYESATLRVQKNKIYDYDFTWRLNDYVNPGLVTDGAMGNHAMNTSYTMQDQDLTLFPQSNIKFFLGYSRSLQAGPAIDTSLMLNNLQDPFPVMSNVRREWNEYRVGNEFTIFGIRVNWIHGWEDFKEDTPYYISSLETSGDPVNPLTISSFQRSFPYHGTSPFWRIGLFTDKKWFSVNGRFTYTAGDRAFLMDESTLGLTQFGPLNQQVLTMGTGQRPVTTGNLSVSFFPTKKLTVTNTTSVYNVRTEGASTFVQFNNNSQALNYTAFEYLGILTAANETDLNYQWTNWLAVYGGYQFTDRRISSILYAGMTPFDQTDQLHDGLFGIRLRPAMGLTVTLDGDIGRQNNPFTPVGDRNYHDLGGHVQYRHKSLMLSASSEVDYNLNSISLTSYSYHSRTYSADASWTPLPWLSFDAGYSKLHLNTVGGIAYFVNFQQVNGQDSIYISNLHTVNAGVQLMLSKRVDLYLGYNRVQDTGDGRNTLYGTAGGATLPALLAAQTFPLTYEAPMGRLSVKLLEKVRWSVGYEYYGYHEVFYARDNFRANTGYTSLLWSF